MYELVIDDRSKILPIVFKLAEQVEPRHGITIRRMSRRSLRRDLDRFAEVYNEAWSENWGFVPFSERDLDVYAQEMQLVFDRNWFMVAETAEGETAAVAITVPDINQVLAKMNGPRAAVRLVALPAQGRRRSTGFGSASSASSPPTSTRASRRPSTSSISTPRTRVRQKWGEMGWILETNRNMNRAMEAMGGRVVRRFRVYERDL